LTQTNEVANSKKKKSQNGQQKHLLMFLTKVSYVSIFFNNITYKSLRHLIYQVMYSGNTYKKEIKKRKKTKFYYAVVFSFCSRSLKWPSHHFNFSPDIHGTLCTTSLYDLITSISNYHYHPYKSMNSSRLLWIEFVLVFSYMPICYR
jgi:hypothetical protein